MQRGKHEQNKAENSSRVREINLIEKSLWLKETCVEFVSELVIELMH